MIFTRLFRRAPSWRHRDPRERLRALQSLADGDPALLELAGDSDPGVRRAALDRLHDPLRLLEHLHAEDDAVVREAATGRLRTLLAGRLAGGPAVTVRLAVLADPRLPPALLVHLAAEAAESALRLAALAGVLDQRQLAVIAVQDAVAEVRLAATERIHDPELLAGLARSFRARDKRLYRLVSERLETVRRRETERLRAAALLDELDALAARERLEAEDVVRAAALEREFGQLPAEADDPARRQAAQARLAPLLAAHQAHGVAVARCLRALDAIAAGFAAHGDATACATALAGLEAEAPADPRIVVRMQALRERLAERGRDTAHAEARERWLNALETLASIDAATRTRLEAEWQALPAPADATLRRRQDERARARLAQLLAAQPAPAPTQSSAPKPAAPRRAPAEPDAQLLARLETLEAALEAGELHTAQPLYEQIQTEARGLRALDARLHAAAARLAELRDWARWGGRQAREQLCLAAEGLVPDAWAPAELARRVQQLRAQWKQLDGGELPATRGQWERFNSACERAYAPAQAAFAQAAAEREQHIGARRALIERLQQLDAGTDWSAPDWRTLDQAWRELQRGWREAGTVPRNAYRTLEQDWKAAAEAVGGRIEAERQRERARREALIVQLQSLADEDLRTAIAAARQAQADWSPTLQLRRDAEQALWLRFRAVCDAIFGRREQVRSAGQAQRQATLDAAAALCAELETLAATPLDADNAGAARAAAARIAEDWAGLGELPRAAQHAIEQRYAAALDAWHERLTGLERVQRRKAVHALAEKATLCARLERHVLDGPPATAGDPGADGADDEPAALREEWQRLARLPEPLERRIRSRLDAAQRALADPVEAHRLAMRMTEGASIRHRLCLELEILAGIEPPPEDAQELLEHRIARLSAALSGEAPPDADSVIHDWYCTPAAADPALDTRFATALVALGQA